MKFLLPSAVLMLMLSVGMSLRPSELIRQWRSLTLRQWLSLLLATFILPPALALLLGKILPLEAAATGGLFLIGVAPGAPLMTRNIARRGFDMSVAAAYQVWGALMIPVMIPLIVALVGKLYDRDIWVPPLALLAIIAKQQFLPLVAGMALGAFAPAFSRKVQRALNILGNAILTVALVALLWKLGSPLEAAVPWVFVAAVLFAVGCLAISRLFLSRQTPGLQTLAVCNVNRHVGLALLLSGTHLRNASGAVPALAAYALAAVFVMAFYTRFSHSADPSTTTA